MIARHHPHELVLRHHHRTQRRGLDGALDQADLGGAVVHLAHHLAGVADRQADLDLRMTGAERHQPAGQPIAGDGLAGRDQQHAARQLAQFRQPEPCRLGTRQHRARLAEEQASRSGQLDAAPDAVEQPDPDPVFQRADRMADRRLGQVERPGGPGHVLPLGNRHEHA